MLYPAHTTWENSKDVDRPLTIGYISPDYFTHSVSYFIEAPLVHHDYKSYRVVVYSAVVKVCHREDMVAVALHSDITRLVVQFSLN